MNHSDNAFLIFLGMKNTLDLYGEGYKKTGCVLQLVFVFCESLLLTAQSHTGYHLVLHGESSHNNPTDNGGN